MSASQQPAHGQQYWRQLWRQIVRRIRVPLGFLFAGIYFWIARPTAHSLAASLLLVLPGLALRAAASGHVKKNEELTTTGPYAYTRNPLYLGSMFIAFGFALASRSLGIAVALAVLFALIYVPTILSEEEFLHARFPEFAAYAHRVPRLLPWRLRPSGAAAPAGGFSAGRFSWKLYYAHREYNALLGSLLLYSALIARRMLHP
jgi:protein-S-isoprenylcysteine O-methyltransferase Ste14